MNKYALLLSLLLAACGQGADPTRSPDTATNIPVVEGAADDRPARPVAATAPAVAQDPMARAALPASAPATLAARFDCLRTAGAPIVAAHRGGPTRDYPENALETLARTLDAATPILEVDIAQSKDGVLFLMHDDTLERTTTGSGEVAETSWAEIEKLKLETYAQETPYAPVTLDAALDWAIANNAVLDLDKKRSTPMDAIIDAIEARKALNNAMIITYTTQQAIDVHARNPEIMITASVRSEADLDALARGGVRLDRLIAWTGTDKPDPALWQALARRGVESKFGTLGARGERLDDVYFEDRDGSEFNDLAAGGLTLVATDFSDRVARQFADTAASRKACGF